nr:PREDICTED: facilitated trehalose transporter Tret1-like [Bemisia tabaci]XP_018901926.1 PREDICTED: facilitated trehalose transporter Tret1-like [Bemisia tabaci]XP_018901927.1 PREDICTED: facilitated trehalose transporter Tret1-like [Bemisia tabaci]XP_018901929.1 PREDICTED: facilitated trehalose transporter Tret1-like [Bemisia tabaci]XP_018901930.1 PREDICTED: facilitated trehalose transporter Tret1-like [Bemisia tabaci]
MPRCIPRHIFNQIVSSITAFLTLLLSGIWLGWMSAVLPKFRGGEIPIPMTTDDLTWTVALMDFGNLLSPIPTGYLMDRYGRLLTLRLAMLAFVAASALVLAASAPYHLFLARLLAGVGKGVGFTAATLYVAEIAGAKIRGALSGVFIVMLMGGTVVSMTVGPYVSFTTLNVITAVCPVVGLFLTLFIVESPYYHLIRDDPAAAGEAFARVRDQSKGAANEAEFALVKRKVAEDMSGQKSILNLFTEKGNRRGLIIILVQGFLQRSGGISCILAYASTTLPSDSFWQGKISVMVFSWIMVVFGLVALSLVDRFGRKPLHLISCVGLTLVTGVSAVYYYFYQKTEVDVSQFMFVPHVGVVLFGVFYPVGVGQIPHTLQSELFPTSVKGQASALMTMALAISSFIVNKVYFAVDRGLGVYFMYLIFALSNFLSMVFTAFYVFETKGKTLEEIQHFLKK